MPHVSSVIKSLMYTASHYCGKKSDTCTDPVGYWALVIYMYDTCMHAFIIFIQTKYTVKEALTATLSFI